MESIKSWKDYFVDNYNNIVSEAWQLGSDARSEAYNIYSEVWNNTGDIVYDVYNSEKWTVTESQKTEMKTENETKNNEQEKVGIFSVEKFNAAPVTQIVGEQENHHESIIDLNTNSTTV